MAFDKRDFGIAAGGALAFLLGWRRLAGIIWGIGGMYEWSRGKKVGGALSMLGGASFTFFPEWPGSLVGAFSSPSSSGKTPPPLPQATLPDPQEIQIAPFQKVSLPSLDMDLGGGWTLLDARDIRTPEVTQRASALKPGDVASLILRNKNGPFLVYNARVISGGNGLLYAGQWATKPPANGPQMPEWSQEHVFAVH